VAGEGEAMGVAMTGKGLAACALGCLIAGAGVFELISPEPPSRTSFDGVIVQSGPLALSISSKAAFVQCFLTLNRRFTAPTNLAAGETQVPRSRFINERDVRFDPAVDAPDLLMIHCSNPVPGVGSFRLTLPKGH
jgi:hypothetical protein